MAGVVLRAATAEDAPRVTEIFLAARRPMAYLPKLHTDAETAEFFAGVLRTSLVELVELAERRGRVVGFGAVKGSWLEHLYVDPDAQSSGVGRLLLGWVKQVCPTGVDLWVFQRNEGARRFYRGHGFLEKLFTDGADNEERQPDVHMRFEPTTR